LVYPLLRPLFFALPPETVHHLALYFLRQSWFVSVLRSEVPARPVSVWNLTFPNPIGLAAGFDKNAMAIPAWTALGFGFVELGTITQHPQPGNPLPRIFRVPSAQALVNRMGFPNEGVDRIAQRLEDFFAREKNRIPIGLNLGKSKKTSLEEAAADYLYSFRKLRPYGDYFVVNVSSPNTPGLRELQQKSFLRDLLRVLQEENQQGLSKPLLVKIAPDLTETEISDVLEVIGETKCAGIVATNTTIAHGNLPLQETGGLSGKPLRARSTEVIRFIAKETSGRLPIIGVGGIFKADDAKEKLEAGAILLQLYTGLIYQGPWVVKQILSS
jgi:dihydroorotate dehydrogenase